jgi:hypothetical protein
MDDDYRDPLCQSSDESNERWLAGFAPVGATEFVVIVQQRYDKAVEPVKMLASDLGRRGWGALLVGVIVLGVVWYYVQRAMTWGDRLGRLTDPSGPMPRTPGSTELMGSQQNPASGGGPAAPPANMSG